MIEVIVPIIVLLCGLVGAMVIVSKRNERRVTRETIVRIIENRRHMRLYKWRDRGIAWREELKKPVKVQFD